MSGYDYSTGRAALFGADDLLPKPLHLDYLLNCLIYHLENNANGSGNKPFYFPLSGKV
jgi:DNA-binding response OmpR family regulator